MVKKFYSSFIKQLIGKKFYICSKVNSRLYIPNIDLSDYISAQVSKVFKNNKLKFNLSSFLSNFIGSDEEVDDKLIEELEEWLNNYNDTENNKYK